MNYSTFFDRFQMAWLGGIIGAAFGGNTGQIRGRQVFSEPTPKWLETREAVAKSIIECQKIETQYICRQLGELLAENCPIAVSEPKKKSQARSGSISIAAYGNILLALLPLFIFLENNRDIYTELVTHCNLELENKTETSEDILIWSYLLTLALNNRIKLSEGANVSTLVKQVLDGVGVKTTSLIEKLDIIDRAWSIGLSLRQLTEKLSQTDNFQQNLQPSPNVAIALAIYCFASTPRNFMLSVKRASTLKGNLSRTVTALTATISGAYNGRSVIPRNWCEVTSRYSICQQAQTTVEELFKIWSGVYQLNNQDLLYAPELNGVAIPQIIQPRRSLKIISQKPL